MGLFEKRTAGGRERGGENSRRRGLLGCWAGAARDGRPYKGSSCLLGDEAGHAGCVRSQEVRAVPGSACGARRAGRDGGQVPRQDSKETAISLPFGTGTLVAAAFLEMAKAAAT